MDLSQREMCLCSCQLRQVAVLWGEQGVLETPDYPLRVILSRDRQRGLLLLQGGASRQAAIPWSWCALPRVPALHKDVFWHYSPCSVSEEINSGKSCNCLSVHCCEHAHPPGRREKRDKTGSAESGGGVSGCPWFLTCSVSTRPAPSSH